MSFRVCLIGCGEHSRSAHAPSLRRYRDLHPDVELAACCDLDPARAQTVRREFGFLSSYSDVEELLDREAPDAVSLVVPPSAAAGVTERILNRGVPVLMEKPPALSGEAVRGLARIAAQRGVPHLVAFNRRFIPLMAELERNLRTDWAPADIQRISYELVRVDRRDPDFSTTAVHAIDAVRFIAGADYEEVRFSYHDLPRVGPRVADVVMEARMTSGAHASICISPAAGAVIERAAVHLRDTSFFLHLPIWNAFDAPGTLVHVQSGVLRRQVSGSTAAAGLEETNGFYQEISSFLDDLRAGRMPRVDLSVALQSVQVMEALRERRDRFAR